MIIDYIYVYDKLLDNKVKNKEKIKKLRRWLDKEVERQQWQE